MRLINAIIISSTYRYFLDFGAVSPRDVGKLVEVCVEYEHFIAVLYCTLYVLELRSLA